MEHINEIRKILDEYAFKKIIDGKSLNELATIDNIPISFFLDTFMDPQAMLPGPINPFLLNKISFNDKIMFGVKTKLIKIYSKFNELRKINYIKKKKQFTKKPKCLFLTYSNHLLSDNKIFRIQKIIDLVKKDKQIQELVLFTDLMSTNNYKNIKNLDNIYQYYDKKLSKKAKQISKTISENVSKIDVKTKKELFKEDEIELWNKIKYGFEFYFSKQFLYLISLYYEISKKIIEKENVKIIVLNGQNGLFDKCMLAAAKTTNIKSMYIKHGMGKFQFGNQYLNYFTKIGVFNQTEKKEIEKKQKLNNLFVPGPFIFDEICDFKYTLKNKNKQKILIATQPLVKDNYISEKKYLIRMKELLIELNKIPNLEITIKLHPRDNYEKKYKKIAKNNNLNIKFFGSNTNRNKYYEIMGKTNFLLHFGSTSSFEAIILNKPVITFDIAKSESLTKEFQRWNIGSYIKEPNKIKQAIKEVQEKKKFYVKNRTKYLNSVCGKVDGKSSVRVYYEIKRLLK